MLVDAHAGGIDHHQFAVETSGNRRQQPIPDTGFAPTHEPVVAGGRRPIALGDFRPRRARSKPPEDPVQHPPIIDPRHTAWLVGQQRLDDCPFPICQFVSPSRHLPLHSRRSLNHAAPANSTRFMSLRPSLSHLSLIMVRQLLNSCATRPTNRRFSSMRVEVIVRSD